MNIFYLSEDQKTCAEMHNDKHCVKMIVEYAQLLSTAHRVLDGEEYYDKTKNGRRIKRWRMDSEYMEEGLMKASHVNHPSNQWLRQSKANYEWLLGLWIRLLNEYTYRYGRTHKCIERMPYFASAPKNIPDAPFTEPTQAMPEDVKRGDSSIIAYRNYYIFYKYKMAKWTKRRIPDWWEWWGLEEDNAKYS